MTTPEELHGSEASGRGQPVSARVYGTVVVLRRFWRNHTVAAVSGVVVVLVVLMAIAAPLIAPADPLFAIFADFGQPPGREYLFGTDQIGRDILSRIIFGGRISLFVALISVSLGTGAGFVWGVASGYGGGKFDLISQRLGEVLMSIPGLVLALSLAIALGASVWTVIFAIAITIIAPATRVIRSVVLSVKEMPYVDSAKALGASQIRIMFVHIAPQAVAVYLVMFTASLGGAILTEAALSFLGVGIQPPTPSWGNMLGQSATEYPPNWWYVVWPGVFITLTVLVFNLFGDGIRDVLDPRLRGSRSVE